VKCFLDTSVLLAACLSESGASRALYHYANANDWRLICTQYGINETECNLPLLPSFASERWQEFRPSLKVLKDIWSMDRPTIFSKSKDKPILYSALAWADVLLTLDQADFQSRVGNQFYGLQILRPGQFLEQQRNHGLLKE